MEVTGVNPQLNVFVSSTCYDLLDVRAQLRSRLEKSGFIVRLSDDYESGFAVEPTVNSIESCKRNVEASDVVVCIVDRRYGPPLSVPYAPQSATHVEVEHAKHLKIPIFYFIREAAHVEFDQLRLNASFATRWVESQDVESRKRWFEFVAGLVSLKRSDDHSNWLDQFRNVVDLCDKVEARLVQKFPRHAISQSLRPERFVRLVMIFGPGDFTSDGLGGRIRNETINVALRVAYGWRYNCIDHEVGHQGALAAREQLTGPANSELHILVPNDETPTYRAVYVEYENVHGDRYRVETPIQAIPEMRQTVEPFMMSDTITAHKSHKVFVLVPQKDMLYVLGGPPNFPQWISVDAGRSNVAVAPP